MYALYLCIFFVIIQDEVKEWEIQLEHITEIVQLWKKLQKNWLISKKFYHAITNKNSCDANKDIFKVNENITNRGYKTLYGIA